MTTLLNKPLKIQDPFSVILRTEGFDLDKNSELSIPEKGKISNKRSPLGFGYNYQSQFKDKRRSSKFSHRTKSFNEKQPFSPTSPTPAFGLDLKTMQNELEDRKNSYLNGASEIEAPPQSVVTEEPVKKPRRDLKARRNKGNNPVTPKGEFTRKKRSNKTLTPSHITINLSQKDSYKKFPVMIKKSINK